MIRAEDAATGSTEDIATPSHSAETRTHLAAAAQGVNATMQTEVVFRHHDEIRVRVRVRVRVRGCV